MQPDQRRYSSNEKKSNEYDLDCCPFYRVAYLGISGLYDPDQLPEKRICDQHWYGVPAADICNVCKTGKLCGCYCIQGLPEQSVLQLIYHHHIRSGNPDFLLHVCMVHHASKESAFQTVIFLICIFHGCTVPDGNVHPVPDGG